MPSHRFWLLTFLLTFQGPVLALAQVPLRIFNPPQAAGTNMGWSVDHKIGGLFMNVPVATVGGEMPVPVVFRFNASSASENHWLKYWESNTTLLAQGTSLATAGAQPALAPGGQWMYAWMPIGRAIFGTVHFGFITDTTPYAMTDPSDGTQYTYAPTRSYVLEDGTQFTDNDFTVFSTTVGSTFSLPPLFQFGARAASSVNVNSQGTLVSYDASATDLGSWAARAQSLAPVGYTTVSGYKVLMDRDRARVYAYAKELNSWVPILWVDRFNHYVGFQWKAFKTGLPSGISVVNTVKVLNHRNKGVQVQWAQPTAGASAPEQVLVRADFINIQAPTLQIKGYSNLYGTMQMKADTSGPVVRPTEVRFGNPLGATLVAPAWMAAALPQPASTGTWSWPADRTWNFGYDAYHSELASISDVSRATTTVFTFTSNLLYNPQSSTPNSLRSVVTANTTDNLRGTSLNASWTWNLPATSTSWAWVSTYTQNFSGSDFSPAQSTTTKYAFVGPGAQGYGNGPLSTIEVLDSQNNRISLQIFSQNFVGVDGTLSYIYPSQTSAQNVPTVSVSQTLDSKSGTPTSIVTTCGVYTDTTTYTYDRHPELLDPGRRTAVGNTRVAPSGTSSAPTQTTVFNASTMLPTQTYIDGGSQGTIGQNMGYDSAGHPNSLSNYASYSTTGMATKTYTLDPTSGLPTSLSVTYDGPSGTNTYAQTWSGYDSADRSTVATDGLGVTTTTVFDAYGRPTSVSKGGQASVNYSYSSDLRTLTTTINGFSTVETRDGFGNLITRQRGQDGVLETYTPDSNGRTSRLVEQGNSSRTTNWTYDALGRKASMTPPSDAGAPATFSYSVDASGNQVVTANYSPVSSPPPFSTQQSQDLWGQVISSVDPQGNKTNTAYDANGHAVSITRTPPGGATQLRSFFYDTLGRLSSRTEPETGTTSFSNFNAQGLPTTITEAGSRIRQVGYDGLGRVRSITGGADSQTFTYTGLKPTSSTASSAGQATSIQYGLDSYGRVNAETLSAPGSPSWVGIGYHYDPVGRLDQLTYPSGRIVAYHYDDTATGYGRLKDLTTGASTVRVDYDNWGNRKNIYYPSGSKSYYQTSASGTRVDSWTVTPMSGSAVTRSYTYDGLNHLLVASSSDSSNPEWTTLTHNTLGQVISATGFGVTGMSMSYDGYGNNTVSTVGGAQGGFINFSFNPLADNRIPTLTNTSVLTGWNINARGEATSVGTNVGSVPALNLTWDGLGKLSSTTLNSITQTYAYLPTGMRVQLIDNGNSSNNRRYAYTSEGQLLGEYTGSGTNWAWKRDVLYLGSLAVLEVDGSGFHELHSDPQGTPRFVTNSSGVQEGIQAFGPYGEALPGPYTSGYVPLMGYTGHIQKDPGTGLIYMKGRFYSSGWHRFLNSDQGVDPGSLNQFAYVGGSPFLAADPSGKTAVYLDGRYIGNDGIEWGPGEPMSGLWTGDGRPPVGSTFVGPTTYWAMDSFGRLVQVIPPGTIPVLIPVEGVVVFRKDIDLFGEDKFGHWWIEIFGTESYGWWPADHVGFFDTIFGTDGILNGGEIYGGTSTTDRHQGDRSDGVNAFQVYASSDHPSSYYIQQIRNFASSYSGSWSWPFGQNCHSFQRSMISTLGFTLVPINLPK